MIESSSSDYFYRIVPVVGRPRLTIAAICVLASVAFLIVALSISSRHQLWAILVSTFAWIGSAIAVFTKIDDLIREFARIHRNRFGFAFFLSSVIAVWVWGVGVIGGSVLRRLWLATRLGTWRVGWDLPWGDIAHAGILVATLLGIITIWALLVTFTSIREEIPRGMDFAEVLIKGVDFIKEYSERGCQLVLCAYYPRIGAVNRNEYLREYEGFSQALTRHNVRCLCLRSGTLQDDADLETMARSLEGKRPTTVVEAVVAFSEMYFGSRQEEVRNRVNEAMRHVDSQLRELENRSNDRSRPTTALGPRGRGLIGYADVVPDFHFLLALRRGVTPIAGFLFVPLRPAGIPSRSARTGNAPPMIGMEVHDPEILKHLDELERGLVREEVGNGSLEDREGR